MSCAPGVVVVLGAYILLLVRYQSGDVVNYNTDIVRVNRFLICMEKGGDVLGGRRPMA
jgi:hypothetical protein